MTPAYLSILLEWFVAILLLTFGLSHVLHPKLWAQLFIEILKTPSAGLFIGALTLPLGLAIVLGHNIWVLHVPVIVTIFGWASTIKGVLYLIHPNLFQRLATPHMNHPRRFVVIGAMMLVLGAIVLANLMFIRYS